MSTKTTRKTRPKKTLQEKRLANPHARRTLQTFKVNNTELQQIVSNAHAYTNGNISKWLRVAALKFKPTKEDLG